MRAVDLFFLATGVTAQSISFVYRATFTETAWQYVSFTTCPCPTSSTGVSTVAISSPVPSSSASTTTTTSYSSLLLPSDTIIVSSFTPTTSFFATGGTVPASSTTTSAVMPVVTDDAYITAILRHHNIHRVNHTADPLVWNPTIADYARTVAESCIYGHSTTIGGGGYGQNIGAGFPATPLGMGSFITDGLYNSEVNNYIYYGEEPDVSTLNLWGHFSQIVWKNSAGVGCYTADCSSSGLANAGPPIPPYFTVCNYAPPGNVLGSFAANVGQSIGLPTVYEDY